jgi:hypothetical protein
MMDDVDGGHCRYVGSLHRDIAQIVQHLYYSSNRIKLGTTKASNLPINQINSYLVIIKGCLDSVLCASISQKWDLQFQEMNGKSIVRFYYETNDCSINTIDEFIEVIKLLMERWQSKKEEIFKVCNFPSKDKTYYKKRIDSQINKIENCIMNKIIYS